MCDPGLRTRKLAFFEFEINLDIVNFRKLYLGVMKVVELFYSARRSFEDIFTVFHCVENHQYQKISGSSQYWICFISNTLAV